MKFNIDTVQKILAEYLEAKKQLEELAQLPLPDLAGDPHKIASAKYHLINAATGTLIHSSYIIS